MSMAAGMATSAGTSKAFGYGDVALGWAKNKVTDVNCGKVIVVQILLHIDVYRVVQEINQVSKGSLLIVREMFT